jgi:two-component system chemotaxis response regulator CheY
MIMSVEVPVSRVTHEPADAQPRSRPKFEVRVALLSGNIGDDTYELNLTVPENEMAKILLVDDSKFATNSLKRICEKGGHEVVGLAQDGGQGVEMFDRLDPDVVILDYLMPVKDGETVLKEIMQSDPNAMVIMLSGVRNKALEQRLEEAGVKAFIRKPWTEDDILDLIEQVSGD